MKDTIHIGNKHFDRHFWIFTVHTLMFGNVPGLFMTAPTHLPYVLNTPLSFCHLKKVTSTVVVLCSGLNERSHALLWVVSIMHHWMYMRNKTVNM